MKKVKLQIKNRWTGNIIFEYESEGNTFKETVEQAIKSDAYLRGANLSGAYLRGANMSGADMSGADLSGTDLSDAYLRGANMRGTDLSGANMRDADLSGTDMRSANLEPIKNDMFAVLLRAIPEIPNFKKAMLEGKIDGTTYSGSCACLCGTLMKTENENIRSTIDEIKDSSRPIERFFLAIKPGDTPENSQFAKLAYEWTEEFETYISATQPV